MNRFLRKLKGRQAPEVRARLFDGDVQLEVKGESFYQEALELLAGGRTEDGVSVPVLALLVREPDNRHDPNAVAVWVQNPDIAESDSLQVGHLSRDIAARYAPALHRYESQGIRVALRGNIVGGWDGGPSDQGYFGITLIHNPADFQ